MITPSGFQHLPLTPVRVEASPHAKKVLQLFNVAALFTIPNVARTAYQQVRYARKNNE